MVGGGEHGVAEADLDVLVAGGDGDGVAGAHGRSNTSLHVVDSAVIDRGDVSARSVALPSAGTARAATASCGSSIGGCRLGEAPSRTRTATSRLVVGDDARSGVHPAVVRPAGPRAMLRRSSSDGRRASGSVRARRTPSLGRGSRVHANSSAAGMCASASASSRVDVDELRGLATRRATVARHLGIAFAVDAPRAWLRARRRTRPASRDRPSELGARHPLGHVLGHAERLGSLVVECGATRHRRGVAQQLLDDAARAGRAGRDLCGERGGRVVELVVAARPGRRGRCAPPRCRRCAPAENIRRFAVDRPTRSGRRTDMPHTGTMPHWPWVSPNVVDAAATIRSQPRASSRPPVKQWPRTLAIVGWGSCSSSIDRLRLEVARRCALAGGDRRRGRCRRRTSGQHR